MTDQPQKQEIQTSVAAAPKQDTVQQALEKMKPQFQMVLPKHLTPERLCRVALNACHATPKLLECDRKSLFSAVMRAAQLGLEPDGVLGQAYLIPFKRSFKDARGEWQSVMEVQFIAGYKGLIDLARRSGDVSNIIAKEVYANDGFSIDWSQEIPFIHKPLMTGDRGEVTHFWAMARFKDGGFHWDYLTKAEVEAIRDKGNGSKNAVWKDYFVEMGKKTAIRRIAKYLPMSVQKAAMTEDLIDAGKSFHQDSYGEIVIDGDVVREDAAAETAPKAGNAAVKDRLSKAKAAGANPETGELPQDDVPSGLRKKNAATPIPMKPLAGNAAENDWDGWAAEFVKQCEATTASVALSALYSHNSGVLEQMEKRRPETYAKCESAYSENGARIEKEAA